MPHKTEAQYQAEADANTLITAEQINAEPKRLQKAKTAARTIAKDAAKAAKQAKKVSGVVRQVKEARQAKSRSRRR